MDNQLEQHPHPKLLQEARLGWYLAPSDTPGGAPQWCTDRVVEPEQAELEAMLQPLVDLLNEKYRNGWEGKFRFTNGRDLYQVRAEGMGALIQLPEWPAQYPLMARALLTIVRKTASAPEWLPTRGPEGDPDMVELDFSITTRTMCVPGSDSFLREVFLLVDHPVLEDNDAAVKQVKLLVEFLHDWDNLVELGPDDPRIF